MQLKHSYNLRTILIIRVFFSFALGYNIDTNYLHVFRETPPVVLNSYFGYSLILHHDDTRNTSSLIIGAPRGYYTQPLENLKKYPRRPGVVFHCEYLASCKYIRPSKVENEEGYIAQVKMKTLIKKEDGWFGSSMSLDKSTGLLTVCAPRTIISIFNPNIKQHVDTMQGMCYTGLPFSNKDLHLEDRDVSTYDFRKTIWYNPLHGFSVHYPSHKENGKKLPTVRIVGEPNHEVYGTVEIIFGHTRKSVELPIDDDLSRFGYSVATGYFFKKDELLYASSSPGRRYVGMVGIISPFSNSSIVTEIYGNDVGEFFGASLSVGDTNNDCLDDLIVGAPHWGHDNGRVYIFLGNSKRLFDSPITIDGVVEDALFGYTIMCGDLDRDGFSDIIVSAPWENSGVIYIYNGNANLKEINTVRPSQCISATRLYETAPNMLRNIERFGFSLSEPVDVDSNGYPDIAVGAYKSGHAVILHGKPVITTNLTIHTNISTLQRNITKFLIKICVEYHSNYIESVPDYQVTLKIDEEYKRTKEPFFQYIHNPSSMNSCTNRSIALLENLHNFIDPIVIFAKHDFVDDTKAAFSTGFCKTCPVESNGNKLISAYKIIPFDIECGEDKVCNSNIIANAKFHGVQDENVWVIGSNDITLDVKLENKGEPAYFSSIIFVLPRGVSLRSILPFCQISSENDLTVSCDIGNPFERNEIKTMQLDLDMQHFIQASSNDDTLDFFIYVRTQSENYGTRNLSLELFLKSEAALSLNGKATEENYYFPISNGKKLHISFQHTYQVLKLGSTPVFDANLIVKVPIATDDLDIVIYVYKPHIYISGKFHECSTENLTLFEMQEPAASKESSFDFSFGAFNETESGAISDLSYEAYEENTVKHHSEVIRNSYSERIETIETSTDERTFSTLQTPPTFPSNTTLDLQRYINTFQVDSGRDVTHLNCTTHGVQCSTITCKLGTLRTPQDVGKLIIKLVIDVTGVKGDASEEQRIIKMTTAASAKILQPVLTTGLDFTGSRPTMQLTTTFHSTPRARKIHFWIVVVSVFFGLLILLIVVIILSTFGFFKRNRKGFVPSNIDKLNDSETGKIGKNKKNLLKTSSEDT